MFLCSLVKRRDLLKLQADPQQLGLHQMCNHEEKRNKDAAFPVFKRALSACACAHACFLHFFYREKTFGHWLQKWVSSFLLSLSVWNTFIRDVRSLQSYWSRAVFWSLRSASEPEKMPLFTYTWKKRVGIKEEVRGGRSPLGGETRSLVEGRRRCESGWNGARQYHTFTWRQ